MTEKKFFIPGDAIRRLVPHNGGCLASDRIMVDGADVGYMYCEDTDRPADTGWRFFAGEEDEDYDKDPNNFGIYAVNTVANYDPDIIPYLDTEPPCAFEKVPGKSEYVRVEDPPTE